MARHIGLHNTYHTHCHSILTYDMVQEDVSSRASFIIVENQDGKQSKPSEVRQKISYRSSLNNREILMGWSVFENLNLDWTEIP